MTPIPGFEGKYSCTKSGKIYSHFRNRYLKPMLNKGYERVKFKSKGKEKWYMVHRLILNTFVGSQPDLYCNHKNGNKQDNRLTNLEWLTSSENRIHALETGLATSAKGNQLPQTKLNEDKVREIKQVLSMDCSADTTRELCKKYDVDRMTIFNIKWGKSWKHVKGGN